MSTTEFLFAMLLLFSFTTFILSTEKTIVENIENAGEKLEETIKSIECAAIINNYYSVAGGEIKKNIDCSSIAKRTIIPSKAEFRDESGEKIFYVEVEKHYG